MSVRSWAERLLAGMDETVRRLVAADPRSGLETGFGLTVVEAHSFAQRGDHGVCDGISLFESGTVLYRPTNSRRENFTLCHELGHFLAATDDACLDWLADQPDPGRLLEQLCDRIAAELLIPATTREELLPRPPTATNVVRLFGEVSASRSACANVAADALPSEGFVVLVSPDDPNHVFYASRKAETRPYAWAGDPLPHGHPLKSLSRARTTHSFWPSGTGSTRRYYMSADVADDGWIVALFSDNNIWGVGGTSFVDQGDDTNRNDAIISCPTCGYEGPTPMWPCKDCAKPPCSRCEHCDCDRDARRQRAVCSVCFTSVLPHLMGDDGVCTSCS